ncbi:MAG: fatty acid desaturase [Gemmataceae bacterium]
MKSYLCRFPNAELSMNHSGGVFHAATFFLAKGKKYCQTIVRSVWQPSSRIPLKTPMPGILEPRSQSRVTDTPIQTIPLRPITYDEVGQHHTLESAYIVYNGLVYDITAFLPHHPGGTSVLRAALGTDITDTLRSMHHVDIGRMLESEVFRNKNGILLIGRIVDDERNSRNWIGRYSYQSRRRYDADDPMGEEIQSSVMAFLRREKLPLKKPIGECAFLIVMFYAAYMVTAYFAFIEGGTVACLLLGPVCTFTAVNVGHTVMHGGFAKSRILDLLGRCVWDFGGYSARTWDVEHQIHHQAPHSSIDLQTAPETGVRFFEHQQVRPHHRFQMAYLWFAFIFYSPVSWVMHTYGTLFKYPSVLMTDKLLHVGFKMIGFIIPITLSFYLHGAWLAGFNLLVFAISMSYFSLFTLFIQHEDSYLPEDGNEPWSVRQVVTSASWHTRNFVFEWFFGYFNYHTEHHLFPSLNPALYPKIQPIVRSICEKYGVRYKYISYVELVRSQIRAWSRYGQPLRIEAHHGEPAAVAGSSTNE